MIQWLRRFWCIHSWKYYEFPPREHPVWDEWGEGPIDGIGACQCMKCQRTIVVESKKEFGNQ